MSMPVKSTKWTWTSGPFDVTLICTQGNLLRINPAITIGKDEDHITIFQKDLESIVDTLRNIQSEKY